MVALLFLKHPHVLVVVHGLKGFLEIPDFVFWLLNFSLIQKFGDCLFSSDQLPKSFASFIILVGDFIDFSQFSFDKGLLVPELILTSEVLFYINAFLFFLLLLFLSFHVDFIISQRLKILSFYLFFLLTLLLCLELLLYFLQKVDPLFPIAGYLSIVCIVLSLAILMDCLFEGQIVFLCLCFFH